MLIIREAQMAALGASFWNDFQRSCVELFAARFPELTANGRDAFEQQVMNATERARAYDFNRREHIVQFVELDLLRGPSWERQPGAERALDILAEPEIDPSSKLHRVLKWVKRVDGNAA